MRRQSQAPDVLRARLQHVRWIGGGSGAGKSTIARRLAADHGFRLYTCDATMAEHVGRSNPSDDPLLHDFLNMDMDERWVNRSPSVMLKTFHGFQGEGFDLILEDLAALPDEPPILAEGFKLLPRLVSPLLSQPNQAVWLIPSPEFRRAAFESRGWTWEIPRKTSDPERALANLLVRDGLFTDEVLKEARARQLPFIVIDGALSVDQVVLSVAESLGLRTR
jgi:2-phosphoglycerate kinase